MPHRFLHIGFTFKSGVLKAVEFEPVFSQLSEDWLRYAPNCWIAWTARPASDFIYALKPLLAPEDLVLIAGLDLNDRNGYQPQWIWEWMDKKRQLGPPPAPAPPPADYPSLLSALRGSFQQAEDQKWRSLLDLSSPKKEEPKGFFGMGSLLKPPDKK